MALKATIIKASISISDMDRSYYANHQLTIAQHPSETEQRLMARILAWLFHASDQLEFTRGLSSTDEPEIWEKNDDQSNRLWIELGHPDEKRIKKASTRSQKTTVYGYQGRLTTQWWRDCQPLFSRLTGVSVYELPDSSVMEATKLLNRTMTLQATIQDQTLWLSDDNHSVEVVRQVLCSDED